MTLWTVKSIATSNSTAASSIHLTHSHNLRARSPADMDSISAVPADAQDEAACLHAMQLVSLSVLPMTLKAAIELGVLETIAHAGAGAHISPSEIVARLPATISNPQASVMLDRILRLLAGYSILTCSLSPAGERRYGAAPVIKYLTSNADGLSMAGLALVNQDRVLIETWYHLKDAVLDGGIPFIKAYGMTVFQYFGKDPRFNKLFNEGMSGHSLIFTNKLLEIYEGFYGLGSLVDVGGGVGSTLRKITAKYPGIKGINFDLPHVISEAPTLPGVEHVSGDMFESVPSADAIFMKWILHGWSDGQCSKLLKNCWKALPENGKVIVAECILPLTPEPSVAAHGIFQLDLNMLSHSMRGKERTHKEFELLAKQAGFSGFKAIYIFSGFWVIEFTK